MRRHPIKVVGSSGLGSSHGSASAALPIISSDALSIRIQRRFFVTVSAYPCNGVD